MNLSDSDVMINNQQATYAILRYAKDIPVSVTKQAMDLLSMNIESIYHRKLLKIIKSFQSVNKIGITLTDELVGSIIVEDGIARYEEDGEVLWSKNVDPISIEIGSNRLIGLDEDEDDIFGTGEYD